MPLRDWSTLIERCLAKGVAERLQSARSLATGLQELKRGSTPVPGPSRGQADESFWVAVAPFTFRGTEASLASFAEGLTAEINTGLSRFSYLRVIGTGSSEKAARYVLDGSVRQAGSRLRVTVQLTDTTTGAQLWGETYERAFDPDKIFDLQDDLVPRIVSTCADPYGVLPRSIGDAVRGTDPARWSPYEALLHFFGYHQRLTAADHLAARARPGARRRNRASQRRLLERPVDCLRARTRARLQSSSQPSGTCAALPPDAPSIWRRAITWPTRRCRRSCCSAGKLPRPCTKPIAPSN